MRGVLQCTTVEDGARRANSAHDSVASLQRQTASRPIGDAAGRDSAMQESEVAPLRKRS
jgi:hypothetical protein